MNFLKRWIVWSIISGIILAILASLFFDLTWMNSRADIPEASFWGGIVFGFLAALKSDN